jgi:hypothetical protein
LKGVRGVSSEPDARARGEFLCGYGGLPLARASG